MRALFIAVLVPFITDGIRFFAICAGFRSWWNMGYFFAALLTLILFEIPLIGLIIGVTAAVEVWDWNWFLALIVFGWRDGIRVMQLFAVTSEMKKQKATTPPPLPDAKE